MASGRAYHCVCSTLILTTNYDLETLPVRSDPGQDKARILHLLQDEGHVILSNTVHEDKPIIIRREDGFEKRILLRCTRCNLVLGYQLDQAHFAENMKADEFAYILPGALITTDDMKAGKMPEAPSWAQQTA